MEGITPSNNDGAQGFYTQRPGASSFLFFFPQMQAIKNNEESVRGIRQINSNVSE
jgi:hypothetical protein